MPRFRRRVSILFVVALSAAGVLRSTAAGAATPWDPRIRPIAEEVEHLRGLKFEHPVPVQFLPEAVFEKRVTVDQEKLSAADKADIRRSEAQLRSLGLLGDDVNLLDSVSSLQTSGALAYYDPETKRAVVRGKELDASKKVTLAHELTHALQDQHFDLAKLRRIAEHNHSSDALKALVEGDAVRVQQLYAAQLSSAERAEYDTTRSAGARAALAKATSEGVPSSLVTLFQSPYTLGPLMLQVVAAAKGEHAIDRLFRDPPKTDAAFLTPTTLVTGTEPMRVAPPELASGETADGKPDSFGAFALYLILAARSDPVTALPVADGWAGDSMVTFRRNGTTCVRASFASRTDGASAKLRDALEQWAAQGPAGAADVHQGGRLTTLNACDPGAAGTSPDTSVAALTVVGVRNGLLATLAGQGLDIETADCTANGVVQDPTFRPVLDAAVADPSGTPDSSLLTPFQQRLPAIAAMCAARR